MAGNHGRRFARGKQSNQRGCKMIFSNDFGLEGFNFLIVNSVVLRM
jgi:hypothetical protein